MCNFKDCKILPSFNYENEKNGLYCAKHKLENMIDIKNKTCKTNLCFTQVSDKYNGYCLYCFVNLFPEKPIPRNYKTKEFTVIEYIKKQFPKLDWKTDKKIQDGCSKRRPDILLDLGYQILIIEIDENQHINYDCSCENKRVMELSQDVNHRPIVFIRFNPDEYFINKRKINSCWNINSKGFCIIKKDKNEEWIERLNVLRDTINYWLNSENYTNKTVEIIQLFYDS